MGSLSNPGAVAGSPLTQVFNGVAPIAWTDLDLSSVVGSNPTLVVLKVICDNVASAGVFAVRRNGDTDEYKYGTGSFGGATGQAIFSRSQAVIVIAVTDVNGIIEHKYDNAKDIEIDVISYVN